MAHVDSSENFFFQVVRIDVWDGVISFIESKAVSTVHVQRPIRNTIQSFTFFTLMLPVQNSLQSCAGVVIRV